MNGPRTDPLASIVLSSDTIKGHMEATITDSASIAFVNKLLPAASRNAPSFSHSSPVFISLNFVSGKSIESDGYISDHSLTVMPPSGDTWGNWDTVTIDIGNAAPKPIAEAFSFAVDGAGRKRY